MINYIGKLRGNDLSARARESLMTWGKVARLLFEKEIIVLLGARLAQPGTRIRQIDRIRHTLSTI
jgi:hypothetical protein